jgi:hypothetical protein
VTIAVAAVTFVVMAAAAPAKTSRCQLLHAVLSVPHSGARAAFRELECVRKLVDRRWLLVLSTITDEAGTRPFLAPGERCASEGYLGVDVPSLSRGRRPRSFVELRLSPRGPDELSFSVLLETWGSARAPGVACGASGEGVVGRSAGTWKVHP